MMQVEEQELTEIPKQFRDMSFEKVAQAYLRAYDDSKSQDPELAQKGFHASGLLEGMLSAWSMGDPKLADETRRLLASVHVDRTKRKLFDEAPNAFLPIQMGGPMDLTDEQEEAKRLVQSLESAVGKVGGIRSVKRQSDHGTIEGIGEWMGIGEKDYVIPDELATRPAFSTSPQVMLNALVANTPIEKDPKTGREYMMILGERIDDPNWSENTKKTIGAALKNGYGGSGIFPTLWKEGSASFMGFHVPPLKRGDPDVKGKVDRGWGINGPISVGRELKEGETAGWIEGIHYNVPTAFGTIPLVPNVSGNPLLDRTRLMNPVYAKWIFHQADPSFWLKASQAASNIGDFALTIWGAGKVGQVLGAAMKPIAGKMPVVQGLVTNTLDKAADVIKASGRTSKLRLGVNYDVQQIAEEILYNVVDQSVTGRYNGYWDAGVQGAIEGVAEYGLGAMSRGTRAVGGAALRRVSPRYRKAVEFSNDLTARVKKRLEGSGVMDDLGLFRELVAKEGERLLHGKVSREQMGKLFDAMWVGQAFGAWQYAQDNMREGDGAERLWELWKKGLTSEDAFANMMVFGGAWAPQVAWSSGVGRRLTKDEEKLLRHWTEFAADRAGAHIEGTTAEQFEILKAELSLGEDERGRTLPLRRAESDPDAVQVPAPGLSGAARLDFVTGEVEKFKAMVDGANADQGIRDLRDAFRLTSDEDLIGFESRLRNQPYEERLAGPTQVLMEMLRVEQDERNIVRTMGLKPEERLARAKMGPRAERILLERLKDTHFASDLEVIRAVNMGLPESARYTSMDAIPIEEIHRADAVFKKAAMELGYAKAIAREQGITEEAARLLSEKRREAVGSTTPEQEMADLFNHMLEVEEEVHAGPIPEDVLRQMDEASEDPALMRERIARAEMILRGREERALRETTPGSVPPTSPSEEAAELAETGVSPEDLDALDQEAAAAAGEQSRPFVISPSPGEHYVFAKADLAVGASGFEKRASADLARLVYESHVVRAGDPQAQAGVAMGMLSAAYVPRGTQTAKASEGLIELVSAVTGVPQDVVESLHSYLGAMPEAEVLRLATKAEEAAGMPLFQRKKDGSLRGDVGEMLSAAARGFDFSPRAGGETTWGNLKQIRSFLNGLRRESDGSWSLDTVADLFRRASQRAGQPLMSKRDALRAVSDPDLRATWESGLNALWLKRGRIVAALEKFRPERFKDLRQRVHGRIQAALKDQPAEMVVAMRDRAFEALKGGFALPPKRTYEGPASALGKAVHRFSGVLKRIEDVVDAYLQPIHYRSRPWLDPDQPDRISTSLRLIAAGSRKMLSLFEEARDSRGNLLYQDRAQARKAFWIAQEQLENAMGEGWNVAFDLISQDTRTSPAAKKELLDVFKVGWKLSQPPILTDKNGNEYRNPMRLLSQTEYNLAEQYGLGMRIGDGELALAPGAMSNLEARIDLLSDFDLSQRKGGLSWLSLSSIIGRRTFAERLNENWAKRGLRRFYNLVENKDNWLLKVTSPLLESFYTGVLGSFFVGGRPIHGGFVPKTEAERSRATMRARIKAEAFFSDMIAEMDGIVGGLEAEFSESERNMIGAAIVMGFSKRIRTPEAFQSALRIPDLARADKMLKMMHDIVNHIDRIATEGVRVGVFSPGQARAWRGQYLARVKLEHKKIKDAMDRAAADNSPFRSGREAHRADEAVSQQVLDMVIDPAIILPLQDHQELERIRAWSLITGMMQNGSFITEKEFDSLPDWRKKLYRRVMLDEREMENGRDRHENRNLTRNQMMVSAFLDRERSSKQFTVPFNREVVLDRLKDGLYATKHSLDELAWMVDRQDRSSRSAASDIIQSLAKEWRKRNTVQKASYWTTNMLTSIMLNWVTGRVSVWDFVKGITTGRGSYAEAMTYLTEFQEAAASGDPDGYVAAVAETDPDKASRIKIVQRFVQHLGSGTFHETIIDPTDSRRLKEELFGGDSTISQLAKDAHLGELIQLSTVKTGQAVSSFIHNYESKVAAKLGGGSATARVDAMNALMAQNQFIELYFKLAAFWNTMEQYGGVDAMLTSDEGFFSEVTQHAAQGTGDYNDRNSFLAKLSGSLRIGLTQLEKNVLGQNERKYWGMSMEARENLKSYGKTFFHIPFTTWGVAMTGMGAQVAWNAKWRILATAGMMKAVQLIAAAAADDETDPEEAIRLLSEAHAGFDPFEEYQITAEDVKDTDLGRQPASVLGVGNPEESDQTFGLTVYDFLKFRDFVKSLHQAKRIHAPKADGRTRTLVSSEYFRPLTTLPGIGFSSNSPGAKAVASVVRGSVGERLPYGTGRDYVGLLPSWYFAAKRTFTDIVFGRKGKSSKDLFLQHAMKFAEGAFGEIGPMALLGRSGQRFQREFMFEGQRVEDYLRGMRDPARVTESVAHRGGRFAFETLFPTGGPPEYSSAEPEMIERGWKRFLMSILPTTPPGRELDRVGHEHAVMRRSINEQIAKIVTGTYVVYHQDGIGRGGLDRMLTQALDIAGDSPNGHLVDSPQSLVGQFIRRAPKGVISNQTPAEVEEIYLRTAYKILSEATFTDAKASILRLARAKRVDPAVFARLWKASTGLNQSGQGEEQLLLDYMYRKLVDDKELDDISVYHSIYSDLVRRGSLNAIEAVGDNPAKQSALEKIFRNWRGTLDSPPVRASAEEKVLTLKGHAIDLAPSLFIQHRAATTEPKQSPEVLQKAWDALLGGPRKRL